MRPVDEVVDEIASGLPSMGLAADVRASSMT
jgi:hypothetical protein